MLTGFQLEQLVEADIVHFTTSRLGPPVTKNGFSIGAVSHRFVEDLSRAYLVRRSTDAPSARPQLKKRPDKKC